MRLDGADIVTGSAHAALGFWLADTGLLEAGDGPARFVGEQGDWLGRGAATGRGGTRRLTPHPRAYLRRSQETILLPVLPVARLRALRGPSLVSRLS
jgi:hypothetical protein